MEATAPPPPDLESLDAITWTPAEAKSMLSRPARGRALRDSIVVAGDYKLVGGERPDSWGVGW